MGIMSRLFGKKKEIKKEIKPEEIEQVGEAKTSEVVREEFAIPSPKDITVPPTPRARELPERKAALPPVKKPMFELPPEKPSIETRPRGEEMPKEITEISPELKKALELILAKLDGIDSRLRVIEHELSRE
jgi:hypothetical protein